MHISSCLGSMINRVRPEVQYLSNEDTEALYQLMIERFSYMRSADISLGPQSVRHNYSGQGESSRWGDVMVFPLSINWEVSALEDKKVIFSPRLSCKVLNGPDWIFRHFADALILVEPERVDYLEVGSVAFPSEDGTFYCLASEIPTQHIAVDVV